MKVFSQLLSLVTLLYLATGCASKRVTTAPPPSAPTEQREVYVPPPPPQPTFTPAPPAAPATNERESVKNALTSYVAPDMLSVGEFNSELSGENAALSGTVTVFGVPAVTMTGSVRANLTAEYLLFAFPPAATIGVDQLTKLLGGTSLTRYLPPGFPTDEGLTITEMRLDFGEDGFVVDRLSANFTTPDYQLPNGIPLSVSGPTLELFATSPTKPERTIGGTITGGSRIGETGLSVAATLNSDPNEISFAGTLTALSVGTLLDALARDATSQQLVGLLPGPLKNLRLDQLALRANPFAKTLSTHGKTSMGSAELLFDGSNARPNLVFGLAPPAEFDFGSIASVLSPLNAMGLEGTALLVSARPDKFLELELDRFSELDDLEVKEGINLIADLQFSGEDNIIRDVTGMESVRLAGAVSRGLDYASFSAGVGGAIKLNDAGSVNLTDMRVFTNLSPQIGLEMGLGGQLTAEFDDDKLAFNTNFILNAVDQSLKGEFFLSALNPSQQDNLMDVLTDGDSSPEWSEPFGIPGVAIGKLGASAGLSPRLAPIFLSELGLTGDARLGTQFERRRNGNMKFDKRVKGAMTVVVNLANPAKSILDVRVVNMTPVGMIEAFMKDPGIEGQLRQVLSSGVDTGHVLVVPTDNLTAFGTTYNRGVAFGASMSMFGVGGKMAFALNDTGVKAAGSLDPVDIGNGLLKIAALRGTGGPEISLDLNTGTPPRFYLDGTATLLGVTAGASALIDKSGFELMMKGDVLGDFEALMEVKGKVSSDQGTGYALRVAVRNDLIARIRKEVTADIDAASRDARNSMADARKEVNRLRPLINSKNREIAREKTRLTRERARQLKDLEKANEALAAAESVLRVKEAELKAQRDEANRLRRLADSKPAWNLPEKAVLITRAEAIEKVFPWFRNAIADATNGVNSATREVRKVGELISVEAELSPLYAELAVLESSLATANLGIDFADGVSQGTLAAAKFLAEASLGGVFDLRTMEFATNLGFGGGYNFSVDMNLDFAGNPHNLRMDFDFEDIPGSIAKLSGSILSGSALKSGYGPTFGQELEAKFLRSAR